MKYQPIIGLEIHIELNTKTKIFCSCLNNPDERRPNVNICPVCTAQPGTLPVINQEAVKKTIKAGIALNCQIAKFSKFDRKNYFYPDLPKGYQISQYDQPLCFNGFLEIDSKKIRIRRVHLEEDTGRLIHPVGVDYSLVDFNRAGVPLMELVTEPDISSAVEARKFSEELHLIMHYLDISDADMEKGQMRVEVNISLMRDNQLGTKVEIKNLNSFRSVERAIEYEIKRQTEILESGERVIQETRGWDEVKGITVSQRMKEEAHDYRYFPEPDLPPLQLSREFIQKIKAEIPELPIQKRERLKREYGLTEKEIEMFVYYKDLGEYFEKIISEFDPQLNKEQLKRLIKLAANYLITDLQGLLKNEKLSIRQCLITPENFAEFVSLIDQGKISSRTAKEILLEMFKTGVDPSQLIEEKGLTQISDEEEIKTVIKEVIKENSPAVADCRAGKKNAQQFLVGKVMAKTKGKANPQLVQNLLEQLLAENK
ncbi:MAG: Asp-tRNA(Asn)/Glu-tRNA(Gln) amidotransferase subunit GatB [Minisyncoccales bacterium]